MNTAEQDLFNDRFKSLRYFCDTI